MKWTLEHGFTRDDYFRWVHFVMGVGFGEGARISGEEWVEPSKKAPKNEAYEEMYVRPEWPEDKLPPKPGDRTDLRIQNFTPVIVRAILNCQEWQERMQTRMRGIVGNAMQVLKDV